MNSIHVPCRCQALSWALEQKNSWKQAKILALMKFVFKLRGIDSCQIKNIERMIDGNNTEDSK